MVGESLRLAVALMTNHSQVAGASVGPAAIAGAVEGWGVAFACPDQHLYVHPKWQWEVER